MKRLLLLASLLVATSLVAHAQTSITITVQNVTARVGQMERLEFTSVVKCSGKPCPMGFDLIYKTPATKDSPVGTYPINARPESRQPGLLARYAITIVPGTLTVTK